MCFYFLNGCYRSKSNGLCIGLPRKVLGVTDEPPSICYSSVADPSVDLFQIGRAESNDIDARGHYSRRDVSSRRGSVSRYAARIHCERDPPHGVRIFASGFNKNKVTL